MAHKIWGGMAWESYLWVQEYTSQGRDKIESSHCLRIKAKAYISKYARAHSTMIPSGWWNLANQSMTTENREKYLETSMDPLK